MQCADLFDWLILVRSIARYSQEWREKETGTAVE